MDEASAIMARLPDADREVVIASVMESHRATAEAAVECFDQAMSDMGIEQADRVSVLSRFNFLLGERMSEDEA